MSSEKDKKCKEYCNGTVYVPLIDTENVEAMLYNMRAMAFCAGWDALDSQLAKRDEEIVRRAFLAARDGLEECSKCGNHTAFDYDSPDDYLNSEEFKKI